jgi:hypothetical protein
MTRAVRTDIRELVRCAIEKFESLSPEEQAAHRREQAISFVYGNLSMTRGWRGTKEDVARSYDDLHSRELKRPK